MTLREDNAVLMVRFLDALRGLYLCSQGATQSFDARVAGTKEHNGPSGESIPEYDRLADKFAKRGLSNELVAEAEEALRNWKRAPEPQDREYERDTLAWKRKIAADSRSATEVARIYWVSRQTVYNYRRDYA